MTTADHESLVGEYAGADGPYYVFVAGPFSPLRIRADHVTDAVRLG